MSGADNLTSTARTVLVVDDDRATRFLIRKALQKDGWTVEEAADGARACASLERSHPDVVLLDVEMPEMDGFATCAHLRALPGGQHVPVLMITGRDNQESITRAYEVGATDFLSKPFNLTVLRQRLQYMYRSLEATRALQNERDFISTVVDTSMALVLILDVTGRIVRFNRSCERVSGLSVDEAKGERVWDLLTSADERERERLTFDRLVSERGTSEYEGSWTTREGSRREIAWSNSVLLSRDGDVEHVVFTGLDTTERNQAEERVRFLDSYDSVTGLPNRRQFAERVDQAISAAHGNEWGLGVLCLDLDRFSRVTATCGYQAGDRLLAQVAERLSKSLRLSDLLSPLPLSIRAELGRPGGDEFAALLNGVGDANDVATVVERLRIALGRPFTLDGQGVTITASVGVALYPADGSDSESLLRNAESAMHAARESVGQSYHFYSAAMHTSGSTRLSLEADLRQAVERDEFTLSYQPKIFATTRRISGSEALIRWQHPSRGLVMPDTFIGIAEETGLIEPIGEWVLREACRQVMRWREAGLQPPPVAVNLSSVQLRLAGFLESVATILNETATDTGDLTLEVTESVIMRDPREARDVLSSLSDLGVRIAIDDFGTGYSTLSSLQELPVHTLKIDRMFVKDLAENTKSLSIVRAMIAMAHAMGLGVVAEGVESESELKIVCAEGCDEIQGFLISRPVSGDQLEALLRREATGETDPTPALTGAASSHHEH